MPPALLARLVAEGRGEDTQAKAVAVQGPARLRFGNFYKKLNHGFPESEIKWVWTFSYFVIALDVFASVSAQYPPQINFVGQIPTSSPFYISHFKPILVKTDLLKFYSSLALATQETSQVSTLAALVS